MNCPKCGNEIMRGHQFCMNCGCSVARETAEEAEETAEAAGTAAEPAPETGEAEAEYPARRRRAAHPAPETEAAPAEGEEDPGEPPAPIQAPAQAPPPGRPFPSPRQKQARPAVPPEATGRKYRRSSGKSIRFWIGILVLVLAAVYVGACILIPDHPLTAPAVNLALTVWAYFSVCGKYLLWFPIALGAVVLLAVLKAVLGGPLRRKLHEADMEEARELASRVVVAETLAPPHQVHAEIEDLLNTRKIRKRYFPEGKIEFGMFSGSGVPLDYSRGRDRFTANFVFQRMERAGTRIFLEIIEWQLNDDIVSKRCLSAMRGLEPMLRDTVLDIDSSASFRVYNR